MGFHVMLMQVIWVGVILLATMTATAMAFSIACQIATTVVEMLQFHIHMSQPKVVISMILLFWGIILSIVLLPMRTTNLNQKLEILMLQLMRDNKNIRY